MSQSQTFDVNRTLIKMYGLEVVVFDDRWPDNDLVRQFRLQRKGEDTSSLENIDRHILEETLKQLDQKEVESLAKKRFLNGGMNPLNLLSCNDYHDLFEDLVLGYSNYSDLALITEISIKSTIIVSDYPDDFNVVMGRKRVLSDPGVEREEFDKQIHYTLLRLFFQDLDDLGEEVSYGRVQFFGRYFHDLFQLRQDKRQITIQKMINREYPYSEKNKNQWRSYFHTE